MKRVALLTDFIGKPDHAYSLCAVAEEQLNMLLNAGYDTTLIADVTFDPDRHPWDAVPLRKLPGLPRTNKLEIDPTWTKDIETMTAMREALEGIDVVLSHDLIYQPAMIKHNVAARIVAQERPEIRWLHWVHSATPHGVLNADDDYVRLTQTPFPQSFVVYPNAFSQERVARNFGYEVDRVKCVHHSTDYCKFMGFQEETTWLIRERRMLEADAIFCYPVRLDRGKQPQFIVRTAAQLKRIGKDVRVVIVDFHSTGGDKVTYREELKKLGAQLGLLPHELMFTSEQRKEWHARVPRAVVRDLMMLANVFIQPSRSETYSLVVQEAALCGNMLILNFDFPPMRDIYGEHAVYMKFSSGMDAMTGLDGETTTNYHPNVDAFCYDIAMRIAYELDHNHVLAQQTRLRKYRNPDYVFRHELEPLFYAFEGNVS